MHHPLGLVELHHKAFNNPFAFLRGMLMRTTMDMATLWFRSRLVCNL
jgi:hypothetical protein